MEMRLLPKKHQKEWIEKKIFAVAYGSGRRIVGTDSYEEYAIVDALFSLFDYDYSLQNPELIARRVASNDPTQWEVIKDGLKNILMLESEDDIVLEMAGMYVKGKWGKVALNSLSDGYRSLSSVIMDFLGWWILKGNWDLENISGIFIVDELEQHLHPKWQRNITKILSKKFPNVQFIGSTHAPICAIGLDDIKKGASQLVKVSYINHHSDKAVFYPKEDFKGYRVDQILTSELFDLTESKKRILQSLNYVDKLDWNF